MSDYYEARITIEVDGTEADVGVRGFIDVETSRSRGAQAFLDGDVEVYFRGEWLDGVELLSPAEMRNAEEALFEAALTDEPLDPDEYAEREEA